MEPIHIRTNAYDRYYINQVGNGIAVFKGDRYMKGHGFLGRVFKRFGIPLLKYLGKNAVSAGVNVAKDVLSGENIKEAAKSALKEQGRTMAGDAVERGQQFMLTGRGYKSNPPFMIDESMFPTIPTRSTAKRTTKRKRVTKGKRKSKQKGGAAPVNRKLRPKPKLKARTIFD